MTPRRRAALSVLPALALMLAGCSGHADHANHAVETADGDVAATPAQTAAEPAGESSGDADGPTFESVTAVYSSCEAVEPLVAAYVDGLVLQEGHGLDEWSLSCRWDAPDDITDMSLNRSVEVSVSPPAGEVLPPEQLAAVGLVPVEHAGIAALGGVAVTLAADTAVAGAVATTTTLPEVEVMVGGGAWEGAPGIDVDGAVGVAAQLLGAA